jgi:hypothetical protein
MSMKCLWGLNHNLQHDASKKPSELPTTTTSTSTLPLQQQYQAGAACFLPLATAAVAGADLHTYMYK